MMTWNPEKELKAFFCNSSTNSSNGEWNPEKELKVAIAAIDSDAPAKWNPEKELKVLTLQLTGSRLASCLVESGEGIERCSDPQAPQRSPGSVESGEGIERFAATYSKRKALQ